MAFVKVWSKRTGRVHSVPVHYLDNPFLMKPFRKSPPGGEVAPSSEGVPSIDWSLAQLRTHAETNGVDLTGAGRSKAAVLERIALAAHPTTVDPVSADPQTSPDTVSGDETAAER